MAAALGAITMGMITISRGESADASTSTQSHASTHASPAHKMAMWRYSDNLVRNAQFKRGTEGWRTSSDGRFYVLRNPGGVRAARVTPMTGAQPGRIGLLDAGDTVRAAERGRTYRATAWVRSKRPGRAVVLVVREHHGPTLVDRAASRTVLRSDRWSKITVNYVTKASGSSLGLQVVGSRLRQGDALFVRSVDLVTRTRVVSGNRGSYRTNAAIPGWNLVWGDEFNGKTVNSNKWRVRDNDYLSYDLARIKSSNVTVGDGVLSLHARRESAGGRSYTSAYMDTIGKQSWTYGRFEMRARLPLAQGGSQGLWPAFWLRPNDGGRGEIDIMEAVGSQRSSNQLSQTIWYDYNGTYPKEVKEYRVSGSTTAYHTYVVEWNPDSIRWYVDGDLSYERTTTTTPWLRRAFDRPFNIRLNLQVGGSWAGAPNGATDFSQTYDIDYVRVYQHG